VHWGPIDGVIRDRSTAVGRLLGPLVIKGIAFTGSDPYIREGSDVAILFQLTNKALFSTGVQPFIEEARKKFGKELKEEKVEHLGVSIESYATQYAAVATDMATGREIWLQSGPIHEAVRASIALPGILSPAKMQGKWLLDGGLCNPIPVSVCRALGADVIIAVNLNGELLGRRFTEPEPPAATMPSRVSVEVVRRMLAQWPAALRRKPPNVEPAPPREASTAPGYFDVLATSINIMQDHITRTRLAGEPPHVMLVPRLRSIGLMEFNRADEAIAEGRACVEQALPTLRRYL